MEWLYFGLLIAIILVMFIVLKRPMYEAMAVGFLAVVIALGKIGSIGQYFASTVSFYALYMIAAFIVFGSVLERSNVIQDMIDIIISLVGRFSGGAGYVALLASSAMGALSASGPGNAAAVGTITIPTMKRTGFSAELAATIEMAASALGPVIPPSNTIVIMYTTLETLYPGRFGFSEYWMFSWVIAFWFIAQRFITLFVLIKKYKVKPVPREERMPIKTALKKGWQSLLLPVVVFLPLFLEAQFNDTFITAQLGSSGASTFTAVLLETTPSLCVLFILAICKGKGQSISVKRLTGMIYDCVENAAPVIVMVFFGFAISEVFDDAGVMDGIAASLSGMNIPLWVVCWIAPLVFTVLGMFLEGTAIILMFGPIFIPLAASVGIHPMLAAAMTNAMSYAMGHMTPPFALCFFICMGIAESEFGKTTKLTIVWCVAQYILSVLILYGALPMFGMMS